MRGSCWRQHSPIRADPPGCLSEPPCPSLPRSGGEEDAALPGWGREVGMNCGFQPPAHRLPMSSGDGELPPLRRGPRVGHRPPERAPGNEAGAGLPAVEAAAGPLHPSHSGCSLPLACTLSTPTLVVVFFFLPQKEAGAETSSFYLALLRIQPKILHCWRPMRRTFKAYDAGGTGFVGVADFRKVSPAPVWLLPPHGSRGQGPGDYRRGPWPPQKACACGAVLDPASLGPPAHPGWSALPLACRPGSALLRASGPRWGCPPRPHRSPLRPAAPGPHGGPSPGPASALRGPQSSTETFRCCSEVPAVATQGPTAAALPHGSPTPPAADPEAGPARSRPL